MGSFGRRATEGAAPLCAVFNPRRTPTAAAATGRKQQPCASVAPRGGSRFLPRKWIYLSYSARGGRPRDRLAIASWTSYKMLLVLVCGSVDRSLDRAYSARRNKFSLKVGPLSPAHSIIITCILLVSHIAPSGRMQALNSSNPNGRLRSLNRSTAHLVSELALSSLLLDGR